MSLGVLNNISAIYAQNNLTNTQASLSKTLQQLSSGSRINSGADDAAGLAVADGLEANATALEQSSQNASDGIGLLQTADGALSQVTTLLNRAVTLATEAANGTLSDSQVSSANQEYQNILTQVGNIGSSTNFNGSAVFSAAARNFFVSDGTSTGSITYADSVGALSTAGIGTSNVAAASQTISYGTGTTSSSSAASTLAITPHDATNDVFGGAFKVTIGSGSAITLNVAAGTTLAQLNTQINTVGSTFQAAGISSSISSGVLTLSGPVAASSDLAIASGNTLAESTPAHAGSGVDFTASSINVLNASTASTVLTSLTTGIADVAYQRGTIGANINQLTSAQSVSSNEQTNLTAAENNISATDYGQAASDLSKYQVLSQTGISALAQANSVQQEVLKLLQ